MVSRRRVLATAGVALTGSFAGCGSDGSDSGEDAPKYDRWLGPETLGVQARAHPNVEDSDFFWGIRASQVEDVTANDRIPEWIGNRLSLFTRRSDHLDVDPNSTDPAHDPITATHDSADVALRVLAARGTFSVDVGSFDVDAVTGVVPDGASELEPIDGDDAYSWPIESEESDSRLVGMAIGEETAVRTLATSDEQARLNLQALLDTYAGEADRLVDVDETTRGFVDRLGHGHAIDIVEFGRDQQTGVSLRFDGATTHRTSVTAFPSAEDAEVHRWADPEWVEWLRTTPEGESGEPNQGKFAKYDTFDHSVDGQFIVFSGTFDTGSLDVGDVNPP